MTQLSLLFDRGATLSPCGRYRYALWRQWSISKPTVLMVGLNPSTADAETDDPTIRRCLGFARSAGGGRLVMANLYAYRATDPNALLALDPAEAIGPETDAYLARQVREAAVVIAAWGSHPAALRRVPAMRDLLPPGMTYALGWTATGQPRHPLYVKKDATLVPWPKTLD